MPTNRPCFDRIRRKRGSARDRAGAPFPLKRLFRDPAFPYGAYPPRRGCQGDVIKASEVPPRQEDNNSDIAPSIARCNTVDERRFDVVECPNLVAMNAINEQPFKRFLSIVCGPSSPT